MVNWKDFIMFDKEILLGKPTIKGTRISVEFILERLAHGWTEKEILENYPNLTEEALQAVFSFSYDCLKDGMFFLRKEIRA